MASIQLRARGEFAPSPATPLAICRERLAALHDMRALLAAARRLGARRGSGGRAARRAGGGAAVAVAGAAGGAGASAGAGAGGGGVSVARAIDPSRAPGPVAGAPPGALATADWPGVYTGGSSSIVYSRTRRPRAQFTSTSSVTKGSEIASVDLSLMTWRPSGVRTVFSCTPLR